LTLLLRNGWRNCGSGRSVTLQQEHRLLAEQCPNTAPLMHLGQDVFDTDIYAGTLM
jgi:hypothetical protein